MNNTSFGSPFPKNAKTLPVRIRTTPTADASLRVKAIEAYQRQVCEYKLPLQIAIGVMRVQLFRDATHAKNQIEKVLNESEQELPPVQIVRRTIIDLVETTRRLRRGSLEEVRWQRNQGT